MVNLATEHLKSQLVEFFKKNQLMKPRIACLFILVIFIPISGIEANEQNNKVKQPPALFNCIQTIPANQESLTVNFMVNRDGDGIGEDLPSAIIYYKKNSKDYLTSMTVTDLSLSKRPIEKKICQSFIEMITTRTPILGTDISSTRIGGSDFVTVFLAKIDSVKIDGVDRSIVFIGANSQDPPGCEIVLYIYAMKGTNLIQLSAPVAVCSEQVAPNQSDISYYKRFCVTANILKKAEFRGKMLTELFRLQPWVETR